MAEIAWKLPLRVEDETNIRDAHDNDIGDACSARWSDEVDAAHAAEIVRRVNAHDALVEALSELHAVVKGECPRLLDEDRGGSARLALLVETALSAAGKDP